MNNKQKIFTIVAILVLGVIVWMGFRSIQSRNLKSLSGDTDLVSFPNNPQQGEPGYQEENTTMFADAEDTFAGNFEEYSEGNIYVNVGDRQYELKTNADEIALQCTTQELKGISAVDFDFITNVIVVKPEELSVRLQVFMPIFVQSADVNGEKLVHTITVPSSVCDQ